MEERNAISTHTRQTNKQTNKHAKQHKKANQNNRDYHAF